MPLPQEQLTVSGGCNCKAIHFKIDIPAQVDRPLHPTLLDEAKSDDQVRLPFVCICHCNDCRRATGSPMLFVICSPTRMISASCFSQSATDEEMQIARESNSDAKRPAWSPAAEAFKPWPEKADNFIRQYRSSEGRTRFFCVRCGTSLAYAVHPMPEPWPPMLDVYIGTIDREDLDTEYMEPERQLWWDWGIG